MSQKTRGPDAGTVACPFLYMLGTRRSGVPGLGLASEKRDSWHLHKTHAKLQSSVLTLVPRHHPSTSHITKLTGTFSRLSSWWCIHFPHSQSQTWGVCAAGTSREPRRGRQCFYGVGSTKATATLVGRQRLLANHRPTVPFLRHFGASGREEGLKCSTNPPKLNQSRLEDHLCLDTKLNRFWLTFQKIAPVPFPPERCSQSPMQWEQRSPCMGIMKALILTSLSPRLSGRFGIILE